MSWNMRARCQAIVSASVGVARRIRNRSDIRATKTDFSFVTTAKRRSLQTRKIRFVSACFRNGQARAWASQS